MTIVGWTRGVGLGRSMLVLLAVGCGGTATVGTGQSGPDAGLDSDVGKRDAQRDVPAVGRRESCNTLDDDLDGHIDEGCPIRLTDSDGHDVYPSLDGDRLAWVRVHELHTSIAGDLYVKDLPDGEERLVANGAIAPSLSGDRVAYLGDDELVVIDVLTEERRTIIPDDSDFLQAPTLHDDLLAWSQSMTGTEEDYEVFVHDLSTGETRRVTQDPTIQEFPVIEGNRIVWTDDRRGHHTVGLLHLNDIYQADLTTLENRPVTNRKGDQQIGHVMALDRSRVLLTETEGPLLEPYDPRPCEPVLYDAESGLRTAIAPATVECFGAWDVSGDRAVVEFAPNGESDIWLIDLITLERRQVTRYPRRSTRAELDGDRLVWQDDRNDHWDLYYTDLVDLEQGDLFPEGEQP